MIGLPLTACCICTASVSPGVFFTAGLPLLANYRCIAPSNGLPLISIVA